MYASTHNPDVDLQIERFIEDIIANFPKTLRATYLTGSWMDGSAVRHSDVDIVLVFEGMATDQDASVFQEIVQHHNQIGAYELGPIPMDDEDLKRALPAYLKHAQHLYGEDVFSVCDSLTSAQVFRRWLLGALKLMRMLRHQGKLTMPPIAPDDRLDTLGLYFQSQGQVTMTKLVVSTIARMVGAIIAHELSIQATSKRDSIDQYCAHYKHEWSRFVAEIWQVFKYDWSYEMPTAPKERQKMNALLQRFIAFEAYFLNWSLPIIVAAQDDPTEATSTWSATCLDMFE